MTKKTLKLALEALQDYVDEYGPWNDDSGAQYVLKVGKEALAQLDQDEVDIRSRLYQRIHELETQLARGEQEPVAWRWLSSKTWKQWSLSDDKKLVAEAVEWLGEEKVQPLYTTPPQRTWVGLMRGVRVEGDNVIISVHYGNDAARQVCGALIDEMNK